MCKLQEPFSVVAMKYPKEPQIRSPKVPIHGGFVHFDIWISSFLGYLGI